MGCVEVIQRDRDRQQRSSFSLRHNRNKSISDRMSSQIRCDWENDQWDRWLTEVGPYELGVDPREGRWWAQADEWDWRIDGSMPTPCDPVELMLEAEQALSIHLHALSQGLRWPQPPCDCEECVAARKESQH
jgi:hypothetical protein